LTTYIFHYDRLSIVLSLSFPHAFPIVTDISNISNRLEDLVAHEDIVNILTKLIDSENLPHLLLYGPPGTGKTSTIIAAAKRMYGTKAYSSMALELNASDARGLTMYEIKSKNLLGLGSFLTKE
jgi:replication factor C subunit 3/5